MPQDSTRQFLAAVAQFFDWLGVGPSVLIAAIGQFAYHAREVLYGRAGPSLLSRAVFAVPSAFIVGIAADAVGAYLAMPPTITHGLAGVFGWLGPAGIQAVALSVIRRRVAQETPQ